MTDIKDIMDLNNYTLPATENAAKELKALCDLLETIIDMQKLALLEKQQAKKIIPVKLPNPIAKSHLYSTMASVNACGTRSISSSATLRNDPPIDSPTEHSPVLAIAKNGAGRRDPIELDTPDGKLARHRFAQAVSQELLRGGIAKPWY